MAVTCEVEAPSAMAFWKRCAQQLPLGGLAGRRDHGNDAKLLPELGDGAQNGAFGYFPAQRMSESGDGGVARLQAACKPAQPAAKPGASRSVAGCGASRGRRAGHRRRAEPSWPPQIGLLAGLAQQVQPHGHAVGLQAHQQLFGQRNMLWGREWHSRSPATASTNEGAIEEENCRLGRKRHNPVSSIHVRASSSVSVPCPFWRILSARDASNCSAVKEKPHFQAGVSAGQTPSPERRAATFQLFQIRWKARWISFQEYIKAIGRPCGQLVGWLVFANSNSNHSIRTGSRAC